MKLNIDKLTIKQKVGQINQYLYGWECFEKVDEKVVLSEKLKEHINQFDGIGAIYGLFRADPWSTINYQNGLSYSERIQVINLIRKYIKDNCSVPIMPLIVEEMPHGHQGLDSVCYPVNIAVGATFNPKLYEQIINEQLNYANYHHINVGLISGLDVARDSRWGRTEETFSSDPYLASRFTKVISEKFKNERTVACLKHFAAQGAPYMGLNSGSVNIGERELREIHLLPTEVAAKEVDFIMAAYNEIDGVPCHANKKLLRTILRSEFGFNGVVMADGQALNRLVNSTIDKYNAAKIALESGVGISLWDYVYLEIEEAYNRKLINSELIDEAASRVLKIKEKLGLFGYSEVKEESTDLSQKLNYQIASESIILQKNDDNYLPISPHDKTLIIGDMFDNLYTFLGDYTAFQNLDKYKNLKQVLEKNMEDVTFKAIEQCIDQDKSFLSKFDKVIVVGGGSSARDFSMEFEDNGALKSGSTFVDSGENVDVGQITLQSKQYQMCKHLADNNINYGFICIQGRPYALKNIAYDALAILSCYYNGQMGPQAIFDTLVGINNPSGKNPITMPHQPEYYGFEYNNKQDMRKEDYINGKFCGFEFGHGLSYSNFIYSDMNFIDDVISINISNDSNISGYETIQLYIVKPNTVVTKRKRELVSFKKVMIEANSQKTVKFEIDHSMYCSLDINLQKHVENGEYTFIIGTGVKEYCSFITQHVKN